MCIARSRHLGVKEKLEAEKNEDRRSHVRVEESREKEERWECYNVEIFEPVLNAAMVGRLFCFGGSVTLN